MLRILPVLGCLAACVLVSCGREPVEAPASTGAETAAAVQALQQATETLAAMNERIAELARSDQLARDNAQREHEEAERLRQELSERERQIESERALQAGQTLDAQQSAAEVFLPDEELWEKAVADIWAARKSEPLDQPEPLLLPKVTLTATESRSAMDAAFPSTAWKRDGLHCAECGLLLGHHKAGCGLDHP